MHARIESTLHTTCPQCVQPLHIQVRDFLRAEGFYRCPFCGAAMYADKSQLCLLVESERSVDWRRWAADNPGLVELLSTERVHIPSFGRLRLEADVSAAPSW